MLLAMRDDEQERPRRLARALECNFSMHIQIACRLCCDATAGGKGFGAPLLAGSRCFIVQPTVWRRGK